jgi:hypothetical protein
MMSQDYLEEFVALLLIDLSSAQHRANEFSAKLAEKYSAPPAAKEPNLLSTFPVPNSHVKACEIQFTVGLNGNLLESQPGLAAALLETVALALAGGFGKTDSGPARPGASPAAAARILEQVQAALGPGDATEERVVEAARQILAELAQLAKDGGSEELGELRADVIEAIIRQRLLDGDGRRGLPIRLKGLEPGAAGAGISATLTLHLDMRDYEVGFSEPEASTGGNYSKTSHLYRRA